MNVTNSLKNHNIFKIEVSKTINYSISPFKLKILETIQIGSKEILPKQNCALHSKKTKINQIMFGNKILKKLALLKFVICHYLVLGLLKTF